MKKPGFYDVPGGPRYGDDQEKPEIEDPGRPSPDVQPKKQS